MALSCKDSGTGFPVVLLHAFPLDGEMWGSNSISVQNAGFRTIIPDFPGFGRSDGLMKGIPDTASLVVRLMDDLKIESAVICGLSMGGYIALEVARTSEDRIAGMVLCDTNPDEDSVEKRKERRAMIHTIADNGTKTVMENLTKALVSQTTFEKRPSIAKKIKQAFMRSDQSAVSAALESMSVRSSSKELIKQFRFPVKLIFGADDVMLPAGIEMHSSIRSSTLDVIPGSGHFPNLETPRQFDRILTEFLQETFV